MARPKKRYQCNHYNCCELFISWQARDRHERVAHAPKPEPKVLRNEGYPSESSGHRLLNGNKLKLGQKVRFTIVGVVKRVKVLDNDPTLGIVDIDKISDTWEEIKQ